MVAAIITTPILLICSFLSKAVKDTLAHHFKGSIFKGINDQFYDASISHANKWKNGDKSQGEAFWLSSTLLVWLTDGWHRFDAIQALCWQIALTIWVTIALPYPWYYGFGVFAAIKLCTVAFHYPYTYLFIKK